MRIAVQNSWPNLLYSAEREFISRVRICFERLQWEFHEVVTSDDIIACDPDAVLVTHEYTAKTTKYPTIGLMWGPAEFYRHDPLRIRNILGYDGLLAGSENIREYLEDLFFSTSKKATISEHLFLPTTHSVDHEKIDFTSPSIFYAGVHWDGDRHRDLMESLIKEVPINIYGDPSKWQHVGKQYKGSIPFDGESIFEYLRKCGVALCLHKSEHIKYNVPSMRIFEAAAASALIITEKTEFTNKYFRNCSLLLENDLPVSDQLVKIKEYVEWISNNPEQAAECSQVTHDVFMNNFTLEAQIQKLPEFIDTVKRNGHFVAGTENKPLPMVPKVEVIVRIGGRGVAYIKRCLDSIADQSYQNIGVIVVMYKTVEGIEGLLSSYAVRFSSIKLIKSERTGYRSTSLWDGLRAVDGIYMSNQDDDDTMHPNHLASLVALLEEDSTAGVAFSGTIQVQEEGGDYYNNINFNGPLNNTIKENRQIIFFDNFDKERLVKYDNYIQSNAWLAKADLLHNKDLIDPKLEVAEDMYLYFIFLRNTTRFLFSWRPTAEWNWRTVSKDNCMLAEKDETWSKCIERISLRTHCFFDDIKDKSQPTQSGVDVSMLDGILMAYINEKLYKIIKPIKNILGHK